MEKVRIIGEAALFRALEPKYHPLLIEGGLYKKKRDPIFKLQNQENENGKI